MTITGNQEDQLVLPQGPPPLADQPCTSNGLHERTRPKAMLAVGALSLAAFAYVTTESLPIGLLAPMSKTLNVSTPAVGWLVTAYAAVVVVASVPLTLLTQRLPRRLVLCAVLGAFVIATVASAAAPTYSTLLAARLAIALSQALFWALVVPTAAGLVAIAGRGRAVAVVFGGVSLANVIGVPGGTWLGDVAGWRLSFAALAGLGLVALLGASIFLHSADSGGQSLTLAQSPDRRRYWSVVALTALATTGSFTAYTYLVPFLVHVAHLAGTAIGPVFLARGVAGVVGVSAGGYLIDRRPRLAMVLPVACQMGAFVGLFVLGSSVMFSVALVAVSGFAFSALTAALGGRIMEVAPGSVDMATAIVSTAVNIGISAGALGGGFLIGGPGARSTVLVASLLSFAALGVAVRERPRRP